MSKVWKTSFVLCLLGALGVVAGIAWAGGDWSAAQSKVEELKRRQMDLRRLTTDEFERVVRAVCEVDETDRQKVAEDATKRVADRVSTELSNLESVRKDADKLLDDVISDDNLKDRRDDARKLKDDINDRWKSIEKMAKNAMRGGNHPIISYMALQGIEEHKNYQRNSSNCHAYEIDTGSRRADCLRADGETCYVIELKPNNSRAIEKGKDQADGSVKDLTNELANMAKGEGSKVMKTLIDKNSDFAKCKRFERRLRCYSFCPPIDVDKDDFYSTSALRGATADDCAK